MQTTLKAIREHGPCEHGWVKLLSSLGKTKADDKPISILEILESNGLDDALWCLRAVDGYDKEIRLYAVWCARQVQHLMKDPRSLAALDVAEAFAHGKATKEELAAARDAARDAARAAQEKELIRICELSEKELNRLRKRVIAQRAELRRLNKIIAPRWAAFSAGLYAAKVTELRGKMIKAFGHQAVYKAENGGDL